MREPKLIISPESVKYYYERFKELWKMRDMNPKQHPMEHPDFNAQSQEPVFYMSHPLQADDKMTFQENVAHAKQMMRVCFDEGFRVVAPYLSIIEVLDDDNLEHRKIGLETDCYVAHQLGRIIMTGHKVSTGMQCELDAVQRRVNEWLEKFGYSGIELREPLESAVIIDCTSEIHDENHVRDVLRQYKELLGASIGG